ncbi:MAG: hypothetical protein ACRC2T_19260 [Thermoguttaceae bacterium]
MNREVLDEESAQSNDRADFSVHTLFLGELLLSSAPSASSHR